MTVRVVLRLVCNVRRARGCHGAYQLVLGAWVLPGAGTRVRQDAATTGWTRERGGGGRVLDLCPACSGGAPRRAPGGAPPPPRDPAGRTVLDRAGRRAGVSDARPVDASGA